MKPIVIGIHGLRNKPPKYILSDWWKRSMNEGFYTLGLPQVRFDFRMAYWAQYMHTTPMDPEKMNEPYIPCVQPGPREREEFGTLLRSGIKKQIMELLAFKSGFTNMEAVTNAILHRMFIELDIYYHNDLANEKGEKHPAKELIRGELVGLLKKYYRRPILLVAHSMGSIIAYDVLTREVPDIPVHSLVTIGSPLGFPVVFNKTRMEAGQDKAETLPAPDAVTHHWYNFADLDDVTSLNYNLRHLYTENRYGVRPFDQIVFNNYDADGEKNPHKAYGYLRTADFSRALYRFLTFDTAGFLKRLGWAFKRPLI